MKLTAQEIRHAERLRKLVESWRWRRWMLVAAGLISAAPLILLTYRVFSLLDRAEAYNWPSADILEVAVLLPTLLVLLVNTVGLPAWAVARWRGDPSQVLLLRLLESHIEENDGATRD